MSKALLLPLCLVLFAVKVIAQVTPVKPDTLNKPAQVVTPVIKNTAAEIKPEKKGFSRPQQAALFSAVLPGAGQAYNSKYWKMPIIYGLGGTLFYLTYQNNSKYQCFRNAYDTYSLDTTFTSAIVCGNRYSLLGMRASRNFYRRNRDLSIIFLTITYALNIVDAAVDAHLRDFDVSEDLSLQVNPTIIKNSLRLSYTPGLNLTLSFKR